MQLRLILRFKLASPTKKRVCGEEIFPQSRFGILALLFSRTRRLQEYSLKNLFSVWQPSHKSSLIQTELPRLDLSRLFRKQCSITENTNPKPTLGMRRKSGPLLNLRSWT